MTDKKPRARGTTAPQAPLALPPLPAAAWALLALVAAGVLVLITTFRIYDHDIWQHLRVGRTIWESRAVPDTQVWVWPTYGQPDVPPSWLFRALLWPFWAVGEVHGLFAWRWLTTLATFAFVWAAAREAGARGPWALVAIVWCALFYRYRSQARPETLVAILLAAQLWVLERRRARGVAPGARDIAWWLVPIAWLWANAHISYYLGLTLTGIHAVAAHLAARRAGAPPQRPAALWLALAACVAVSFVNPFGWKLLWQPFEYFLVWRHEPIYQTIGEMQGIEWSVYAVSYLPLWLALLGVLALVRWRRHGVDWAQLAVLLVFVPQALFTQRFLGYLAVMAAPLFARDADEAMERGVDRVFGSPWLRAAGAALLMVLLPLQSLTDEALKPGYGIRWEFYPVRACDWIEQHGVRGRGFNAFDQGGYLLWRFWPDRGRLPFMDIHQSGTRQDRYTVAYVPQDSVAWRTLDNERRFDWVIWPRKKDTIPRLPDFLDADTTTWALVLSDDAAALWLRRDGSMAPLAERERYRWLPAGTLRLAEVGRAAFSDTVARAEIRAEFERALAASPYDAHTHSLMANLELSAGNWNAALVHLAAARRAIPWLSGLEERERLARDSLAAEQARR
ncbi:MAG: hypothetical protein IT348_17705 [Candidatus Eisenbacteria bacterium]|nr:hypothetical protein [Candidatus Eisenbacteria bacterium]